MRQAIIVGLCSIAAVVALVVASGRGDSPDHARRHADKTLSQKRTVKAGMDMTLSIKKATPAGEPMALEIELRNVGKQILRYGPTDAGYGDFQILVKDGARKPVPLTRTGKASAVQTRPTEFTKFSPRPIGPGEGYVTIFNLTLLYDLTLPGKYRVSVATEVYPPGSPKNGKEFVIEATGLTFEVTSAAPPVSKKLPPSKPGKKRPPAGK